MSTSLVTIAEAARQLAVHPMTVRRLIYAGRLDKADVGVDPGGTSRGARIHQRSIDDFVAARTTSKEK